MKVAVVGATGFVGRRLVPALQEAGHDVVAVTRRPERYAGPGRAKYADLDAPRAMVDALVGVQAVYFLAHSLGTEGFLGREYAQAHALIEAADRAGVNQVIYLSGLARAGDRLSPHLHSRRATESVLSAGTTPVTILRAGILIGSGSTGWEILKQTVEMLPVIVTDVRARTRHQPIAADDAVKYLVDVLGRTDCLGATFDIGGDDVLSYRQMVKRLARLTRRFRPALEVPWMPGSVTAVGVSVLTDVNRRTARHLLDSMGNETVVTDHAVTALLPREVLGFDDAVRCALAEDRERRDTCWPQRWLEGVALPLVRAGRNWAEPHRDGSAVEYS